MNEREEEGMMTKIEKHLLIVIRVICSILCIMLLAGCPFRSSTSPFIYNATITEGRAAAKEIMEKTGASSISLSFIDGDRLVWTESFGLADKESKTAPTADTMYCIGSTSKVLAAIVVMKLVDQKLVSLDAPLANYIKSFSMLSPEYKQITIRMLLNHSSGFPGTDERNAETGSPLRFDFSAQVLETLKSQRLKHPPGYLNVYCNDGFTIIEQLVVAVTGKSYAQFAQDEIFTPLGMNHSQYPRDYFPDGSFAKRYKGNEPMPQLFLNTLGSGGLYSTPTDMAKIAMMLIGRGKLGDVRSLSENSVLAMGVDQTLSSFNAAKANGYRYGLGWDTVHQPGLGAVGVTGWQKGGDVPLYGSVLTIAPAEKLAVFVIGASGSISSSSATIIAERILLRALAEKGRIAAMPDPLKLSPRAEKTPKEELLNSVSGYYANYNTFMRVQRSPDNSLNIARYDASINRWKDWMTGLKLRDDDWFTSDANPSGSFSFRVGEGRQYLVVRSVKGYGHYQDDLIYGQRIAAAGDLPIAWKSRLGKKWLLTNEHPDFLDKWASPLMQLHAVDNLLFADWGGFQVVNPFFSDSRAGTMLLIPQVSGRDINDVVIEIRGGEEWLRFGSYICCPRETIQTLQAGNNKIDINTAGLAEWRLLEATSEKTVTITPGTAGGCWKIYDSNLKQIETGKGAKCVMLSGGKYYLLFHNTANVRVLSGKHR